MKRAGLIALLILLGFSLPAPAATSKNPYNKKARAHAKALKQRPSVFQVATPPVATKPSGDPTPTWQPYSYP